MTPLNEEVRTLLPLLAKAAKKLAAVKGPVWSSYNSGAEIAAFVLECKAAIERVTITLAQKQELWGIFAPTCDWDDVVGDCEIGNRVFVLVDTLYGNEIKEKLK